MWVLRLNPSSCHSKSATLSCLTGGPSPRQQWEPGSGGKWVRVSHNLSDKRLLPPGPTTAFALRTEPACHEPRALQTDCVRVSDQNKPCLWAIISFIHLVKWRLTYPGFTTALPFLPTCLLLRRWARLGKKGGPLHVFLFE